jgi:glycosyltransferase involved in cell wall biosynthesis
LNEEERLPRGIVILHNFLQQEMTENPWRIVIADNGSTDRTRSVSEMLVQRYPGVGYLYIPQRGRGRALRAAWMESTADIVSYMDVDISTSLAHFPRLVRAIERGYDVAIGSRHVKGARIQRSFRRDFLSKGYNLLIRAMFFVPFKDAQCGYKVLSRRAARALIPMVKDNRWFFDTELLIIAANWDYRIREVPVEWVEDTNSRVKVLRTVWEDIKGLLRLRLGGIPSLPEDAFAER